MVLSVDIATCGREKPAQGGCHNEDGILFNHQRTTFHTRQGSGRGVGD